MIKRFCVLSLALVTVLSAMSGCSGNKGDKNNSDLSSSVAADDNSEKFFDNRKIIQAYKTSDNSKLSQLEKDILDEAKKVIDNLNENYQTDYELELAVHDFLVENISYDIQASEGLSQQPAINSDNPYGVLLNKQGIALGYSTTFQLFMDILEIPCITVLAEDKEGDEHSFNQVQLGSDWYYVDCTSDDPVPETFGRGPRHDYFNVTQQEMSDAGVEWDTDKCNPAISYEYSYYKKQAVVVKNLTQLKEELTKALENGHTDIVISCKEDIISDPNDWQLVSGSVYMFLTKEKQIDNMNYYLFEMLNITG